MAENLNFLTKITEKCNQTAPEKCTGTCTGNENLPKKVVVDKLIYFINMRLNPEE